MRARGLKPENWKHLHKEYKSRPMRARGLKPIAASSEHILFVAPHAGAWIETPASLIISLMSLGRAPCGRVD